MAEKLFLKQAYTYAKARPTYPPALFERLASLTKQHERAWDVGTGNGQAACMVAEHYKSVVATDVSEPQLSLAAQHPNVTYSKMSAMPSAEELERIVGPEGSVDLVTVAAALHWFDFDKFYPFVKHVLRKPGGVLAAWTYGIFHIKNPEINKLMEGYWERAKPYSAPQSRYYRECYKTIPFPFEPVEPHTEQGGAGVPEELDMKKAMKVEDLILLLKSTSTCQTALDQGVDLIDADVTAEWMKAWGEEERIVTIPLYLLLGTVSPATART